MRASACVMRVTCAYMRASVRASERVCACVRAMRVRTCVREQKAKKSERKF